MFGVLRESDILAMRSDVARIIADNPADIEIRRGNTTLPAQQVRVEKAGLPGGTAIGRNGVLVQRKSSCTVLGAIDLDIEVEDRFTWGGGLYRVNFVEPNRQIGTQAEAYLDQ